jgi:hypothetical protein
MGWRFRKIECKTNTDETSSLCKAENKPEYYEMCDAGECAKWQYGGWSTCSTDCGEGVRRRLVVCTNSNGLVLENKRCTAALRPDDVAKCAGSFCGKWLMKDWSECDYKTCTRVRTVYCNHENGTMLPDNNCNKSEKPNYIAECESRLNCNHFLTNLFYNNNEEERITNAIGYWDYTNWSRCSTGCGPGVRTRKAVCKSTKNSSIMLPVNFCPSETRETLQIRCNIAQCAYKIIENWGQCSSNCGQQGVEMLERKCYETVTKMFTPLSNCGLESSVSINRTCYKPCPRQIKATYEWKITNWRTV